MLVKVLIEQNHTKILQMSKQKRYGEDSPRVRTAYELSTMIKDGSYSLEEISEKAAKEGVKSEYKPTTFNLASDTVAILDELCSQTHLSRAQVIRAIIMIQKDNLDGTRTDKSSVITAATLNRNSSVGETLGKILYNFNTAKNGSSPVANVLEMWTENNDVDIESPKENAALASLYNEIGWGGGSFSTFDVISSLYKPFLCFCAVNDTNSTRPLFKIDNHHNILFDRACKRSAADYIIEIKKEFFAKPYIDFICGKNKNLGNRSADKEVIYEKLVSNPAMNELAKLTYTVANFAPCPSGAFNQIKGIIANDSLSLFVNILRCGYENPKTLNTYNNVLESSGLKLTPNICHEWIDWLIENRSKAFLEDYYYIDKDRQIKGITNQICTIPENEGELCCYIQNTISRINSRALRIAQFIANK